MIRVRLNIVEETMSHTLVTFDNRRPDDDAEIAVAMTRDVWRELREPRRVDIRIEAPR